MKLFICCSSNNGISNEHFNNCKTLLEKLLKDNDLVFGACNSGLMGLAYNIAIDNRRNISGICPEAYKNDLKTLKRCHEFNKPIIIYNSNEYFDKLLDFMEKIYRENFSKIKDKNNYLVTDSVNEILYYLNNYEKIKYNEKMFGISYEELCEGYKRTNGF